MRKQSLKITSLIIWGLITTLNFACKTGGTNPTPQPVTILPPEKPVLLLPAKNEVCAAGENQTATESTVRFDWNDAANANSYVLTLKNLITGAMSDYPANQSEIKIAIPRAAAFSWMVTSKSAKTTTTAISDSWRFYNSGEGQVSYAPFPASLTFPAMGQVISAASTVTLTWTGSDAENDLTSYDIYFGKIASPVLVATNKADVQSFTTDVSAGTIYYWKVVTKDAKGNTSDSGIYQFKIN